MFRFKKTDYSSSIDDFYTVKSQLEKNLEVLQLQLNQSERSISEQLEEEFSQKYTKLKNFVCIEIDTKTAALGKQEQLQALIDYLLKGNQTSVEKYEMLKTCVDWISTNNKSTNTNKLASKVYQSNITEERKTVDDDIYEEQQILKKVINILVWGNASPEELSQLKILIDTLAESSISRDYIDGFLKDQATKTLEDLQKISAEIKEIDKKNCTLYTKNVELQVFFQELKTSNGNNVDLIEEEIKKQKIIIKEMQNVNDNCKMEFEKMFTETNENLNKNIVQIIHKLLAERML